MHSIWWRIIAAFGIGTLIVGVWFFGFHNNSESIIDRTIAADVSYTIYVPRTMPDEYVVKDRGSESNGVIHYAIQHPGQSPIAITLQQSPSSFDMTKMIGDSKVRATSTGIGDMYDMSAGGASRFLIDTGGTLIFITSSTKLETSFVRDLANSMQSLK